MCGHCIPVCINLVTCAQGLDRKVVTRSMSQIRITRYYIVSRSFTVAEHAQLSDERRYDYECKLYSSMSNPTHLFHSLDYDKLPDETVAILHIHVFQEYISIYINIYIYLYILKLSCVWGIPLAHLPLNEMVAVSQTIFPAAFEW